MEQPTFLFQESEWVYRLLSISALPQLITSGRITSIVFDLTLFTLPALFLFSLKRVFVMLFAACLLFYFMTFNMITGHHYHSLAGLIVITIPFWFKREDKFHIAWSLARYYLLYVFASAALWKITRGSAFEADQLSNILKAQQLDLLLQQPESISAHLVQYLISNTSASHALLLASTGLQLSFLVGFFTHRFDRVLILLAVLFCIANYFVMSINSFELLILTVTLLKWKDIPSLEQHFPRIAGHSS